MGSTRPQKPRRGSAAWVTEDELDTVLRALRERLGVTQKEIADRADVSPAMIARLESGDRRPSKDVLGRLAAVFGTTTDGLTNAARSIAAGTAGGDDHTHEAGVASALDALPAADVPAGTMSGGPPAEVPGSYTTAPQWHTDPSSPPAPRGDELRIRHLVGRLAESPDSQKLIGLVQDVADWLADIAPVRDLEPLRKDIEVLLTEPTRGTEPVAAMPSGEVRYVFAHALGKDDRGGLWIDPLARARIGGYDHEDPRIERYDDGRIVVDVSRLGPDVEFAERDHTRHIVRTIVDGDGAADDPALTEVYANSVIEITWTDSTTTTVQPRAAGITDGDFPDDIERIHIITAFNPQSRLLRASENEERNRLLERDLDAAGLSYVAAVGRSPDGSWTEDSYAVTDSDREQVLELARRYEQAAIFEWTPEHRAVLWTQPSHELEINGWQAHVDPSVSRTAVRPASS